MLSMSAISYFLAISSLFFSADSPFSEVIFYFKIIAFNSLLIKSRKRSSEENDFFDLVEKLIKNKNHQ